MIVIQVVVHFISAASEFDSFPHVLNVWLDKPQPRPNMTIHLLPEAPSPPPINFDTDYLETHFTQRTPIVIDNGNVKLDPLLLTCH